MIKKLQHRKLVARMCRGEKKFTIHKLGYRKNFPQFLPYLYEACWKYSSLEYFMLLHCKCETVTMVFSRVT